MLVAHRGFRTKQNENQYINFATAWKIAKGVEFDIRLTHDKKLIIFHDEDFKRIGKSKSKVKELTYEEIMLLPYFQKEKDQIPILFEDLMNEFKNKYKFINIEIKGSNYSQEELKIIFKYITHYKDLKGLVVSSFERYILEEILWHKKSFKTGYLFDNMQDFDKEFAKKFDFIHAPVNIVNNLNNVKLFKSLQKPLNVWTYKTSLQAKTSYRLYGKQISAYISDNKKLKWK